MKPSFLFLFLLNFSCYSPKENKNMETSTEWTKELAIEYFSVYARFEKIPLEEGIKINNIKKFEEI